MLPVVILVIQLDYPISLTNPSVSLSVFQMGLDQDPSQSPQEHQVVFYDLVLPEIHLIYLNSHRQIHRAGERVQKIVQVYHPLDQKGEPLELPFAKL